MSDTIISLIPITVSIALPIVICFLVLNKTIFIPVEQGRVSRAISAALFITGTINLFLVPVLWLIIVFTDNSGSGSSNNQLLGSLFGLVLISIPVISSSLLLIISVARKVPWKAWRQLPKESDRITKFIITFTSLELAFIMLPALGFFIPVFILYG